MGEKYTAKITKKDFDAFTAYCKDKDRVKEILKKTAELFGSRSGFYETAEEMFDLHFMGTEEQKYTFNIKNNRKNADLKMIADYLARNDLSWQVAEKKENILHLNFSGNSMLWLEEFCTLEALPDYDGLSMGQIQGRLEGSGINPLLPAEMGSLTINDMNSRKDRLKQKQKDLKSKMDDIQYEHTKELARMKEKIQKLQDALYKKKQELLSELNEKMNAMQKEKEQMEKQIYMMESEIYTIRSYSGETVELRKIRDGKKASLDTPLIINQKLMYLDEDLARIMSIYQHDISMEYQMFADAAAANDEVFESFCPQERCLTFFRLSRKASYNSYNGEKYMYETEQLIHGKKMGFILRDMECAYIGWLDESWKKDEKGEPVPVTFEENLMYQPKKTDIRELPDSKTDGTNDSQNSMLSRVFAMAVVQGILDSQGLLEFPEKVSVTKPCSYLSYNFADGWIMDDRFGDFATLVDNLNKRTKVKDQILVCKNKTYGLEGRGEADRTHDCEVLEGVNRVNYIEKKDRYGNVSIYVSAKKRYSTKGATANILCTPREYINITYMNSIWMKYYVQTKKLGRYVESYAEMIKHFKKAIEVISDREAEEMRLIKQYYEEADQIPEWQICLSHWKLNHHIRFINSFQAKRVADYLKAGNYEENAHLFEQEIYYNNDETNGGMYSRTVFSYEFHHMKTKADRFEKGSSYEKQAFYLKDYDTSKPWNTDREKKRKEKNACVVAKGMPALEAAVPERIRLDEEKLSLVCSYVNGFLKTHHISIKELKDISRHNGIVYDEAGGSAGFVKLCDLPMDIRNEFFKESEHSYPEYILKSECWKVAYYDYIHAQYGKILYDAKTVLHERHMNDTKKPA